MWSTDRLSLGPRKGRAAAPIPLTRLIAAPPVPPSAEELRRRLGRGKAPKPTASFAMGLMAPVRGTTISRLDNIPRRGGSAPPHSAPREEPVPPCAPPTAVERSAARAIPRRIVQSWVSGHLTPGARELCASHRNCNPGYEYVFYDDAQCREFIGKHFHANVLHAYDAILPGAFKADLFRYCELYVNGGWWFDMDVLSVAAIDALVGPEVEFACPADDPTELTRGLYQAVLGASRRHAVLGRVIADVVARVGMRYSSWGRAAHPVFGLTGPTALADALLAESGAKTSPSKDWFWATSLLGRGILVGASTVAGGHCTLGKGALCIAHALRRASSAQRRVHDAYMELRRATPRCSDSGTGLDMGYCSGSYRYPNQVSRCQPPLLPFLCHADGGVATLESAT